MSTDSNRSPRSLTITIPSGQPFDRSAVNNAIRVACKSGGITCAKVHIEKLADALVCVVRDGDGNTTATAKVRIASGMLCPHCKQEIPDSEIQSHAARLAGRKSRRKLSPEQARDMQEKSAAARRRKRDGEAE